MACLIVADLDKKQEGVCVCVRACVRVCVCMCVCACTHACTHAYSCVSHTVFLDMYITWTTVCVHNLVCSVFNDIHMFLQVTTFLLGMSYASVVVCCLA